MLLFSFSIFFGKLLTLLPFLGFYILNLFVERKIKKSFADSIIFFIPLALWLALVSLRYEDGSVTNYVSSLFDLILNHQSSGTSTFDYSNSQNFIQTVLLSEFSSWNIYEKIRILIVPGLFLALLYLEKEEINNFFGSISLPLAGSIFLPYIWF